MTSTKINHCFAGNITGFKLLKEAEKFVVNSKLTHLKRKANLNLFNDSFSTSSKRFIEGLKQLGITDFSQGQFLWHGTSDIGSRIIMQNGFDTSFRRGQFYGTGEYFADNFEAARGYSHYKNSKLFYVMLVYVVKDERVHHTQRINDKEGTYHIIKNEDKENGKSYCLPVEIFYNAKQYNF